MLEIGALAVVVAGASYGYSLYLKGRAHTRFKLVFEEIAKKLGGRASPGTIFDAPELRVTVGGNPILLRLRGIEHPDRGVAIAEVPLGDAIEKLRLYLGWDVSTVPRGLEHIPEISVPRTLLDGRLAVRANDSALAARFLAKATFELQEMRRESQGRAIEVLVRGGTLQFAVHGIRDSIGLLERTIFSAIRIKDMLIAESAESAGSAGSGESEPEPTPKPQIDSAPSPVIEPVSCVLCGDWKKKNEAWVKCARCLSPYHAKCFAQATGCIQKDCAETRALAFDKGAR